MDHDPAVEVWTRAWIPIGAVLFLVALAVSALVVPQLRLLHLLQALIYVVVVILARRNSAWGFGAGFAIAAVWNCLETFGPHLMQTGAVMIWSFLHTGQVQHLETMQSRLCLERDGAHRRNRALHSHHCLRGRALKSKSGP